MALFISDEDETQVISSSAEIMNANLTAQASVGDKETSSYPVISDEKTNVKGLTEPRTENGILYSE